MRCFEECLRVINSIQFIAFISMSNEMSVTITALHFLGYFVTYSQLAATVHSGPRAVGNALRHNPFAPRVPCEFPSFGRTTQLTCDHSGHRVIASSFSIGGFCGSVELESADVRRKLVLLQEEGLHFTAGSLDRKFRCDRCYDLSGVSSPTHEELAAVDGLT